MKRILLLISTALILALIFGGAYFYKSYYDQFEYQAKPFDHYLSFFKNDRFLTLLNQLGYKVRKKIAAYAVEKYKVILVAHPVSEQELKEWRKWVKKEHKLVLFFRNEPDLKKYYLQTRQIQNSIIKDHHPYLQDVQSLLINQHLNIDFSDAELFPHPIEVIVRQEGRNLILREKINQGEIIYLTDPYLFSDKSILNADNAVFLNNLFKQHFQEKIVYDLSGQIKVKKRRALNLNSFLFKSHFPYLLAQVILFCLVFFLTFYKRFGNTLDYEKYTRRTIVHHLQAVGYFFQKTGNKQAVISILDRYFLERLQKMFKIQVTDENNLIREIKKRFDLSEADEDLFRLNQTRDMIKTQIKREQFLDQFRKGKK